MISDSKRGEEETSRGEDLDTASLDSVVVSFVVDVADVVVSVVVVVVVGTESGVSVCGKAAAVGWSTNRMNSLNKRACKSG